MTQMTIKLDRVTVTISEDSEMTVVKVDNTEWDSGFAVARSGDHPDDWLQFYVRPHLDPQHYEVDDCKLDWDDEKPVIL